MVSIIVIIILINLIIGGCSLAASQTAVDDFVSGIEILT